MKWTWLWIFVGWLGAIEGMAQSDIVYIENITMEGNQRTRDEIILRELKFRAGDTISVSHLERVLEESEQLVMNTGMFNSANITIKNWRGADNHVHLHLELVETWYIYPVPIFELADRNFNVWWVDQNHSLQRINFGMEFTHLNFTGQRDRIKLTAKYGYTRSYAMKYTLPFINKSQTLGVNADISFSRNRELNYASIDNKQSFYKDEDNKFLYQRFRTSIGFPYRPGYHLVHDLNLLYQQNWIDKFVAQELNPDFFLEGRNLQRSFSLTYRFEYDWRDVRAYPIKGNYFNMELRKVGLGFFKDRDALDAQLQYHHYFPLSDKWSAGVKIGAKASFIRKEQPFNDYRAFGFGQNNLYGYELYVVNGMDMGLSRGFLRYRLFQKDVNFGKWVPIPAFRKMPIKVYFSLNQGAGYINDPYTGEINPFSNRMLFGGGVGLDVILYYDKVLQIQYSYNHLWEKGVFLHFSANI
ncbi:MAG: BamA/TamA family outer membrane protein [Saprospiraceae bacterium]|nr:BamA/TamA family outer membrane protein [Saprospiraceae bacterium]